MFGLSVPWLSFSCTACAQVGSADCARSTDTLRPRSAGTIAAHFRAGLP